MNSFKDRTFRIYAVESFFYSTGMVSYRVILTHQPSEWLAVIILVSKPQLENTIRHTGTERQSALSHSFFLWVLRGSIFLFCDLCGKKVFFASLCLRG